MGACTYEARNERVIAHPKALPSGNTDVDNLWKADFAFFTCLDGPHFGG
uniref:Uncharacterized protein n=1 Tax=Nelumbo nucifera TaxID=4432 RepID=A0A822Z5H8_NELNU|nr:TPA_asm: hypothetical protein HUJ06_014146 [Nelumbo nucifera]